MDDLGPLDPAVLPEGVRSRLVDGVNGLRMHVLEAGTASAERPTLLLLHGFPELAYSWRKVMPLLAAAGFYVIAPDQRGYGRTTGWVADYNADIAPFRFFNLVRDAMGLLAALGIPRVGVVGHDFGSPVAAWCALLRPDIFTSVALMSAPFAGPPALRSAPSDDIHAALAALARPRKHYQWYYSGPTADRDMCAAPQGMRDFLRAYYHMKSADWPENRPAKLASWTAPELAKLPTYYIMDLDQDMAQTVAPYMPKAPCGWLTDDELSVYAGEFSRTGLQGGLNWYRCSTATRFVPELQLMAGRTIDVPSLFIAGRQDWGVYQIPGAFERMQDFACTQMRSCHLLEGAGHWVQQEQPDQVAGLLCDFFFK